MGAIFAQPLARAGVEATAEPRAAMVARGGSAPEALEGCATICLGAEREGLRPEVLDRCQRQVTIPLRPGAVESLNVAAAAAIALERVASAASRSDSAQASEREK
jgi:tRNA C32,U32 (ribose-2'-O)-methylase TrmJ